MGIAAGDELKRRRTQQLNTLNTLLSRPLTLCRCRSRARCLQFVHLMLNDSQYLLQEALDLRPPVGGCRWVGGCCWVGAAGWVPLGACLGGCCADRAPFACRVAASCFRMLLRFL